MRSDVGTDLPGFGHRGAGRAVGAVTRRAVGAAAGLAGVAARACRRGLGLPAWLHAVASVVAVASLGLALAEGGSDLPLWAQVTLAGATLVPWVRPARFRANTVGYSVLSYVPVAIWLLSGGHPVLLFFLAVATARVAAFAPVATSAACTAAGIAVVGVRSHAVGGADGLVWASYIQLGAALGWALRSQRLLVLRAEGAVFEQARVAAVEERRRIARDVHDTLAHSLTVMMVQLNSVRLQIRDDPERVAASLDDLAAMGRASLEEVRRSVGLLAQEPARTEPFDPTSAAFAVEELVGSFRRAGCDIVLALDVDMACMGRLAASPTAVWSTSYRIVQEAVANAVRHAPDEQVGITVTIDDRGVRIEVVNALPLRPASPGLGTGHGIGVMGERVSLLGGSFSAGPLGGGWSVRADLPLQPAPTLHRAADAHWVRAS